MNTFFFWLPVSFSAGEQGKNFLHQLHQSAELRKVAAAAARLAMKWGKLSQQEVNVRFGDVILQDGCWKPLVVIPLMVLNQPWWFTFGAASQVISWDKTAYRGSGIDLQSWNWRAFRNSVDLVIRESIRHGIHRGIFGSAIAPNCASASCPLLLRYMGERLSLIFPYFIIGGMNIHQPFKCSALYTHVLPVYQFLKPQPSGLEAPKVHGK